MAMPWLKISASDPGPVKETAVRATARHGAGVEQGKGKRCTVRFYAELNDFLPPQQRQVAFRHFFSGRPTVKNLIEGLGVPHTEVDLILVNGESVDFGRHVEDGDFISVRRILLTRDRGLLKRSQVTHGYLVRESDPREQLAEVLRRFDLWRALRPFSRCLRCNGELVAAAKEEVADRLPSKVRERCREFSRCQGCGRAYWKGSHYDRLARLI